MKVYQTNEIKNIALLGSKGSGKTTLAESMLYECGVIKRGGTVRAGSLLARVLKYFLCRIPRQETQCDRLPGS